MESGFNTEALPRLVVVADSSGSMTELGQNGVLGRCLSMLEYAAEGLFAEVSLYLLSDRLTTLQEIPTNGFPACAGCCDLQILADFARGVDAGAAFLYIGDGNYLSSDWRKVESVLSAGRVEACVLSIGCGAKNRQYTHGGIACYPAEEMKAALMHLACAHGLPEAWPADMPAERACANQEANRVQEEEEEDEW